MPEHTYKLYTTYTLHILLYYTTKLLNGDAWASNTLPFPCVSQIHVQNIASTASYEFLRIYEVC